MDVYNSFSLIINWLLSSLVTVWDFLTSKAGIIGWTLILLPLVKKVLQVFRRMILKR